jgi:hypothetical protein
MSILAVTGSAGGFLAVMIAWVSYLATIPSGKVPVRPIGTILLQLVGMALAISAIVLGIRESGSLGVAVIVPAVFAIMMASTFFYLLSLRKTPVGDLKVKVGDSLLPFEATASDGTRFYTDSLAGKKTLFKFYRGGW